jgi:alpha-ribazole phosphatase
MNARLLIIRHGQTDWNQQGRFQGQSDLPLNSLGLRLAQAAGWAAAQALNGEQPQAIYASDLRRAWQSAEAVHTALPTNESIPLIAEPRLREMSFGDWEGMTYAEIQARYSGALQRWEADLENIAPPNGETLRQMVERVQAALNDLLQAHPNGTTLLVGHGGPLQLLIALTLGLPPARFWQIHLSNASLSELRIYPEGAILNLLNCTSHLKGIE